MTKLDIAKGIIKQNVNSARCGIFASRSLAGDSMKTLYNKDGLQIDICYYYEYFEVFGLPSAEFEELKKYYKEMLVREKE